MDDDDELLPDDPEVVSLAGGADFARSRPSTSSVVASWKVLIVDDDQDVRLVSELALRGLTIDDRPVSLMFAANAAEARRLLAAHEDIAVALVDVVMERKQAGLELVRWIRAELGNWWIRLVVRTGEPGSAPEARVMADHELHDYLAKSETTARRLISCVTGALRAWRDQYTIRLQRCGLRNVLAAVEGLFDHRELNTLLHSVLRAAADLIGPETARAWLVEVLDAAGREVACHASLDGSSPPAGLFARGLPGIGHVQAEGELVTYRFDLGDDSRMLLALTRPDMNPWEGQLLEIYGHAVALSLRHRRTWETSLSSMRLALEEREVMLREIHHRVKNSLQITASLLALQADRSASPEARDALEDSVGRVRSMALVHQQLYAGGELTRVPLDEFCRDLVNLVCSTLAPGAVPTLTLQPTSVSIEQAIPFGLILNELLTNALKHGRSSDGQVLLHIALTQTDEAIVLTLRDEGPGLPGTLDAISSRSLGLQVVDSLSRQLKARLQADNASGARFTLRIPRSAG